MRVSQRDLADAFRLVSMAAPEEAHAGGAFFGHEFLESFRRLVRADYAEYGELDMTRWMKVSTVETAALFETNGSSDRSPTGHTYHYPGPRAARLSDFYGPVARRESPAPRRLLGPQGVADDLRFYLAAPARWTRQFTFERADRPFGERERTLLELLRPHLSLIRDHVEPPASGPSHEPDAHLTPRESEVLDWVANGKTNKEVAAILGVSPHTIRTQLEHVFQKLDVHTRTAAVAKARGVLSAGGVPRR